MYLGFIILNIYIGSLSTLYLNPSVSNTYLPCRYVYLTFMMCLCEFQENIPMYYIMYLCYFNIPCILYKYIGTIGTYYIVLKIAIICRYFILLYVLREWLFVLLSSKDNYLTVPEASPSESSPLVSRMNYWAFA